MQLIFILISNGLVDQYSCINTATFQNTTGFNAKDVRIDNTITTIREEELKYFSNLWHKPNYYWIKGGELMFLESDDAWLGVQPVNQLWSLDDFVANSRLSIALVTSMTKNDKWQSHFKIYSGIKGVCKRYKY